MRRERASAVPDKRPKMPVKSKQMHLLKEESTHRATSPYGRLWNMLSQPLLWRLPIYGCLLAVFFTIVFALLFHNFM